MKESWPCCFLTYQPRPFRSVNSNLVLTLNWPGRQRRNVRLCLPLPHFEIEMKNGFGKACSTTTTTWLPKSCLSLKRYRYGFIHTIDHVYCPRTPWIGTHCAWKRKVHGDLYFSFWRGSFVHVHRLIITDLYFLCGVRVTPCVPIKQRFANRLGFALHDIEARCGLFCLPKKGCRQKIGNKSWGQTFFFLDEYDC